MSRDTLELAVAQFAPRLRAPADNLQRIAAAAPAADLVLSPELSLTGYDVGDAVHALAVPLAAGEPLPWDLPDLHAALLVGAIEAGPQGPPYNAAVLVHEGVVRFRHRKLYLPTYGMFDESRFFRRGTEIVPVDFGGWRLGVLVCEDFWHPGLAYVLASAGIDALLVQAAAPGRGVWEGGDDGRTFASEAAWERIARTTAQLYGIYVALANRTGVEDSVTFAGGSLVVGPDGSVLARAGDAEETLRVVLQRAEVLAARRPYAHVRDDDPELVRRALEQGARG